MCFFHTATEADDHSHPSGLALKYIDRTVRPQDDLYGYTSGKWLKEAELPADRARFGSFDELRDKAELQVRAIIEEWNSLLQSDDYFVRYENASWKLYDPDGLGVIYSRRRPPSVA
jgi:predicted metalloendopeptidase